MKTIILVPTRGRRMALCVFAVGALLGGLGTADVHAQASIPIVQARPDTGSRIRRELVRIQVPYTKSYAELTPEQRTAFRAQFEGLAPTDDPPYPVAGLLPIVEELARSLSDGKVSKGTLFVSVHINEEGVPQSTKVYDTPDSGVSREAARILMASKFTPGRCAGKPCSAEFPFVAQFVAE